jgi:hypothetical protein
MRAALSSAAWVLAAACYQPTVPAGVPCSESRECAGGQACIQNVCGGPTSAPDAPDAPASLDAPAPDAPPGTLVLVVGSDPSHLRDTELWLDEPVSGHGGDSHFSVDNTELGLIKFNLSMVPAGATVLKATLGVYSADEASEDGGTVVVYRVREDWDEGEATWFERKSGQAWAKEGAQPPSRETTPLAELRPQQIFAPYEAELPLQVVQDWLAQPQSNFGIAIVRGTSVQHVHLRSRESGKWSTLRLELRP